MIANWEIDFGLFSGVADQLQTNYAGDLRNILKCVFDMNCSDPVIVLDESPKKKFDRHPNFMARRTNRYGHRSISNRPRGKSGWWFFTMFSHMCVLNLDIQLCFKYLAGCRNVGKQALTLIAIATWVFQIQQSLFEIFNISDLNTCSKNVVKFAVQCVFYLRRHTFAFYKIKIFRNWCKIYRTDD